MSGKETTVPPWVSDRPDQRMPLLGLTALAAVTGRVGALADHRPKNKSQIQLITLTWIAYTGTLNFVNVSQVA